MALTLLLGGARSGKSALAVRAAGAWAGPVEVVVTGEARDAEMAARIERHRAERPAGWRTVEAPVELEAALRDAAPGALVVVDCLTLWVSNLMELGLDDAEVERRAREAAALAASRAAPTLAISNEVGSGIVPALALARRYRDLLGQVNATWAAAADQALLLVAGRALPLQDPLATLGNASGLDGTAAAPEAAPGRPAAWPAGRAPWPVVSAGCPAGRGRSPVDEEVAGLLAGAPGPDQLAAAAVARRAAGVLRPAGALARLDELAAWLAAWQGTDRPAVRRPAAVVFAADHGVARQGVSAYPAEVTTAMLKALREGAATACVMSRQVGAALHVVDVGVGDPTGDLATEPALDPARFRACFDAGRRAVAGLDADLLVLGEMGIGNTTAAAAVTATLLGGDAAAVTGRGTGVDDAGYARKLAAVRAARRRAGAAAPLEVLRQVGGAELAAIAGAATEARLRPLPLVLDGFVVAAAVAPLAALHAGALAHAVAGHRSAEPGHRALLERLGKPPLLDLDMRLGEASGALAAVPLLRLAAAAVTEVATFAEWGLERP